MRTVYRVPGMLKCLCAIWAETHWLLWRTFCSLDLYKYVPYACMHYLYLHSPFYFYFCYIYFLSLFSSTLSVFPPYFVLFHFLLRIHSILFSIFSLFISLFINIYLFKLLFPFRLIVICCGQQNPKYLTSEDQKRIKWGEILFELIIGTFITSCLLIFLANRLYFLWFSDSLCSSAFLLSFYSHSFSILSHPHFSPSSSLPPFLLPLTSLPSSFPSLSLPFTPPFSPSFLPFSHPLFSSFFHLSHSLWSDTLSEPVVNNPGAYGSVCVELDVRTDIQSVRAHNIIITK